MNHERSKTNNANERDTATWCCSRLLNKWIGGTGRSNPFSFHKEGRGRKKVRGKEQEEHRKTSVYNYKKNEKKGRIHGTRCAYYATENKAGRTYGRTDGQTLL